MKDFEVCDEESLEKMLAKVRAAQEKFATYTQEQVDEIFYRRWIWNSWPETA